MAGARPSRTAVLPFDLRTTEAISAAMAGSWQLLQPLTTAAGKERLVEKLRRLARSRREFAAWRAWEREVVFTASPALTEDDLRYVASFSPGGLSCNERWQRWALQVGEVLSDYLEGLLGLLGLLGEAQAPDFVDELGRLVAAHARAAQNPDAHSQPRDRGGRLPVAIDPSMAVPWWRRRSEGPLRDFQGARQVG